MRLSSGHFGRDIKQASAYPRLSGGQPSLVTGAEHRRSCPRQARSFLNIRAAFWYGAVRREADVRWL